MQLAMTFMAVVAGLIFSVAVAGSGGIHFRPGIPHLFHSRTGGGKGRATQIRRIASARVMRTQHLRFRPPDDSRWC